MSKMIELRLWAINNNIEGSISDDLRLIFWGGNKLSD